MSHPSEPYDVIVIGARCAGSPTAMLLARKGYRVLLVDRATFPSDMPMSTHMIHPRGCAALERWGILPAIEATKTPPVLGATIDVGAFSLTGIPQAVDDVSKGFAPRRVLLDEILVRAAEASGAELRENFRVEDLVFEGERVVGIRGRLERGARVEERARFVIGADGPSSLVAKKVKAEESAQVPALQTTAWSYWSDLDGEDRFLFFPRALEAVYAFATSGDQWLVGTNWATERYEEVKSDVEKAYFATLERCAPALATAVHGAAREDRFFVGSTPSFFRKPHGQGWALVGDASYKKDPCTAQGITDAFIDSEILTEAIDQVLADDVDEDAALGEYERRRDEWARPFYDLTVDLARFAAPAPETVALYQALRDQPEEAGRFVGLMTEATNPTEFFEPSNIERILNQAKS